MINSLLFLVTFISMINIMSINWKPFPTFELYRDYSEILKINYEELNTLFINQFKDDIVFSFIPNLLLFCVSVSIFILLKAKLRINRSIKNNLYRNYNLIISQTMNRILILMIPLSILFSYLLFLPRSYGVLAHVWRPEIVDHKLLIHNLRSMVIVLNQIVLWISTGTLLLINIFFSNNARNKIFSYRIIRRELP